MTAVLALLARVPAAVWEALCVVLAVLLLACSLQLLATRAHLASARTALATQAAAWATERATLADAAQQAEAQGRAREQAWANAVQEQQHVIQSNHDLIARMAGDLQRTRTERDGLRDEVLSFAGGGDASADSLSACRERSATLGRELVAGLPVQEELARRAETCAGDLRAVLASWPR